MPSISAFLLVFLFVSLGVKADGLSSIPTNPIHKPIRHYDFVAQTNIFRPHSNQVFLSFAAYNTSYRLVLEPNHDLLHDDAVLTVHSDDSNFTVTQKPLFRQKVHAYRGRVVEEVGRGRVQDVGWARVLFHDDDPFEVEGRDPMFEGVFTTSTHGMHHIKSIESYKLSKRSVDVDVASPLSRPELHRRAGMIIFRDMDDELSLNWSNIPSTSSSPLSSSSFNDDLNGYRWFDMVDQGRAAVTASSAVVAANGTCPYQHANTLTKRAITSSDVHTCGTVDGNRDALEQYLKVLEQKGKLEKRQGNVGPTGCPASRMVLFMAAAADCTYIQRYGGQEQALKQILTDFNTASAVYESTFNIALGLIEVKLVQACGNNNENPPLTWNQPCSEQYTINDRLSDFSEWRGAKQKIQADQAGLWHLLTQCSSGASVGVAWLAMLCNQDVFPQSANNQIQFVSGTGVSSIVPTEWKVVAHEIGHNFGAIHDCISSQCPVSCAESAGTPGSSGSSSSCPCCPCGSGTGCDCQGQFLMHPTDNSKQDAFSPCSVRAICGWYPRLGTCLKEPNALRTITTGICGNGVREGNEQCDCGSQCANDPCCEGTTCKLKPGAVCDERNDECCQGCRLKANGTVCRASNGVCDFAEVCDGVNATCPRNAFVPDGTACTLTSGGKNSTGTTCASGVCTSRDAQCQSHASIITTVAQCKGRETDCELYCQDESGLCLKLNGFFLDGTPCGFGGSCRNGNCRDSNVLGAVVDWFKSNPQIAIPV
ncbi:hypothetical protein HK102_004222, partial [Quaeritorhiza haematococci]